MSSTEPNRADAQLMNNKCESIWDSKYFKLKSKRKLGVAKEWPSAKKKKRIKKKGQYERKRI